MGFEIQDGCLVDTMDDDNNVAYQLEFDREPSSPLEIIKSKRKSNINMNAMSSEMKRKVWS